MLIEGESLTIISYTTAPLESRRRRIMKPSLLCCLLSGLILTQSSYAASPPPPICGNAGGSFFSPAGEIPISNSSGNITSQIVVSGLPTLIWDVDATILIEHTSNADLDITLTSPSGVIVTLTTDNGGANDNVFNGTTFDDQANPTGQVPYDENFGLVGDNKYFNNTVLPIAVPEEPLAALFGEDPNGVWTLTINDDTASNNGKLISWGLDIVSLKETPFTSNFLNTNSTDFPISTTGTPIITSTINLSAPSSDKVCHMSVDVQLDHTFPGDIDMTLTSPLGKVATLTTDNGIGSDNIFSNVTFTNTANLGGSLPYTNNSGMVTDHAYSNLVSVPSLTPEESLAAFNGEPINGTWTLTVSDDANQDGGLLKGWTLKAINCFETDFDGDGTFNSCDECATDPAKVSPGQCGCHSLETDDDSDGKANCVDACPSDAAKSSAGICGCGVSDIDSDGDGSADCIDQCPSDGLKTSVGICGCGVSDANSDGDSAVNCQDQCPNDGFKTAPGICGCGVSDSDGNGNGVIDCLVSQDLKANVNKLSSLFAQVKVGKNGKLTAAGKTAKDNLVALLVNVNNQVAANSAGIAVNGTKTLAVLSASAQSKLKKALKTLSLKDRKAANGALKQLLNALV